MNAIPDYLQSTVQLLRRAFPDGISERDHLPLVWILYHEGNMSIRTLSESLGYFLDRPAVDFVRDVDTIMPEQSIEQADLDRVRNLLMSHGFAEWLEED